MTRSRRLGSWCGLVHALPRKRSALSPLGEQFPPTAGELPIALSTEPDLTPSLVGLLVTPFRDGHGDTAIHEHSTLGPDPRQGIVLFRDELRPAPEILLLEIMARLHRLLHAQGSAASQLDLESLAIKPGRNVSWRFRGNVSAWPG